MTKSLFANVVWLKRDLRLSDHEPLTKATHSGLTILYYAFEPLLVNDPHYDERHWRFILQSINDINNQLVAFNSCVYVYFGDALNGLNELHQKLTIKQLYSHEEVGIHSTYNRDKVVYAWTKKHNITWHETAYAGVIRGKKNRKHWDENWNAVMNASPFKAKLSIDTLVSKKLIDGLAQSTLPASWSLANEFMFRGGETWAKKILQSFLNGRGKGYHFNISKPFESRKSCSRLSPYLAWGNISLREFYQALLTLKSKSGWQKPISALISRLHWHCHFIQKFESEHQMQWRAVNRAYEEFNYPELHCHMSIEERLTAWKTAKTGYPLVDACMTCLHESGYLNFRMRAMLVSFLCHHLLVDWRLAVEFLARLFLDFEPGIHYPQFQMQSGITGTNTIRVYNPVKQSQEHDANAIFIKRWLPQLTELPKELIHTPWLLSSMEQQLYQCYLGETYPNPIVDIDITGKIARDLLWGFQERFDTKQDSQRIIAKHVRVSRRTKNKTKKVKQHN
jgi:deoxyribodipyrimidine photo-lyase